MADEVLLEIEDGIATVTLNRPEQLNAINLAMGLQWLQVFDELDRRDDVRAVILTGAGRAFCAGADLAEGAAGLASSYGDRDEGGRLSLRMFQSRKPIIVAFNGAAVGAGMSIPLAADIRIASQEARFGMVFVRRGVVPEAASSWFLPRVVGIQQALDWTMSGRIFDAAEALRGGLVLSTHPADALLDAARAIAREIIEHASPVGVALTRHLMWSMLGASHPMEAHRIDSKLMWRMANSGDAEEGVASFLEKRPPQFPLGPWSDMPPEFPWAPEPPFGQA